MTKKKKYIYTHLFYTINEEERIAGYV